MTRNPVILLHGIDDTCRVFRKLRAHLERRGWEIHCLNLHPNDGSSGLEALSAQLASYIERAFDPGTRFDLVGFSMGGIVARHYLQRRNGLRRVHRLVTVSSPHHGTVTAYLRANRGARQMRPGSPFLNDLNQDRALLREVSFTSLWTPFDLMILPATSSVMAEAATIKTPALLHAWMIKDNHIINSIASALLEPPRPRTTPG